MKYHAFMHIVRRGFVLALDLTAILAACGEMGRQLPSVARAPHRQVARPRRTKTPAEFCASFRKYRDSRCGNRSSYNGRM